MQHPRVERRAERAGHLVRRRAPSTTSRHQCSRISASVGSLVTSRARASSWLKAYSTSNAPAARGGEQGGEEPVGIVPPHDLEQGVVAHAAAVPAIAGSRKVVAAPG